MLFEWLNLEYNAEDRVKALVREGREEGRVLGMAKAIKNFKARNLNMSNEEIAQILGLTVEELQKYLEAEV